MACQLRVALGLVVAAVVAAADQPHVRPWMNRADPPQVSCSGSKLTTVVYSWVTMSQCPLWVTTTVLAGRGHPHTFLMHAAAECQRCVLKEEGGLAGDGTGWGSEYQGVVPRLFCVCFTRVGASQETGGTDDVHREDQPVPRQLQRIHRQCLRQHPARHPRDQDERRAT